MDSKRPFYQLVIAWLVVVTVITAIALLRPSPVLSDVDLTQAVNSAFLPRTEDPALHDLAHQRAMYQVTYSGGVCLDSGSITHDGMTTTEVVACNQAAPDPIGAAVQQWFNSAPHAAILGDSRYNLIGCASATSGTSWFFVCTLGTASPSQPVVPAPPAEVPYVPPVTAPAPPAGTEPAPLLPNTALRTP